MVLNAFSSVNALKPRQVPMALGQDGGHCPTPPLLLQSVRDALKAAAKPGRRALVFIKRKRGDMRGTLQGESELEQELRGWAPDWILDLTHLASAKLPEAIHQHQQ